MIVLYETHDGCNFFTTDLWSISPLFHAQIMQMTGVPFSSSSFLLFSPSHMSSRQEGHSICEQLYRSLSGCTGSAETGTQTISFISFNVHSPEP